MQLFYNSQHHKLKIITKMAEKDKTIEELNEISKGLNLLSRERKVVLSHHKAFDLVDDLKNRMEKLKESLKDS